MMNKVAIIAAGITDCRSRWVEATYWDLFQQATRRTLEDAKMTADEVDSVVYGIYNDIFEHQAIPESALAGTIGMAMRPGTRVSSGGATGFYAMRTAIMEVASGMSECSASAVRKPDYDP
jgi:acetyl-CoA acetyltransferase